MPDSSMMVNSLMSPVFATWLFGGTSDLILIVHRFYSRSAAEFYTGFVPFSVLQILRDFVGTIFQCHNSDGIRVSLAENRPQSWYTTGGLDIHILSVNREILLYPIKTNLLDLLELGNCDWSFMAEIEA
jgi:hypothetical protein